MSLLQQDTSELDDAARGEDLTKGTSHLVWATVVATVVVTILIGVYVLTGQKPPAVTGELVQVWAQPLRTQSSGVDANGDASAVQSYEQVLVFAEVRLHNQSKEPLFLHQAMANTVLSDGIHSSYVAIPADYERIFEAYPQVKAPHDPSLATETTIDPGKSAEGEIVSAFKISKQQWDARKNLSFTFVFNYQPELTLTPKSPVVEEPE